MKYFVFVDESGNNDQENLFLLGALFVPVEKIGEYYDALTVIRSKITSKIKQKEKELEEKLSSADLLNFYKGRRRAYEIKFKHINMNVVEEYGWLVSQYFKFSDVRYCCLVIDKNKYPSPDNMSFFDVYMNQLVMLLKNNIHEDEEIVLLPDNITISGSETYEAVVNRKLREYGKNIFGTHRLDSHSDIFIQMTDVLTGAILHDSRNIGNSKPEKEKVAAKIREKTGLSNLAVNGTPRGCPNYFSVWQYKR
jgi:hypothetical protein